MSIKIHWGPPGSYKTSGAIMDDFIFAAMAGRTVVTNVRGLNDMERVRSVLAGVPDSFELLHVPTHEHEDSAVNRELMARWFHWIPKGALLLLDEAQDIWPKKWTQKDLALFDYPGGVAMASADKRPASFNQAFEMHRHHGWDIILTTPDISLIRSDVRATAEGAFKHDNQAMIGLKGWYMETFHLATNRGVSVRDRLTVRPFRRIPKHVFELYQSTATGQVKDTLAGLSLFKNPRIVFLLFLLAVCAVYFGNRGIPSFLRHDDPPPSVAKLDPPKPVAPLASPPVAVLPANSAPPVSASGPVAPVPPAVVPALMPRPFQGYRFRLSGHIQSGGFHHYYYEVFDSDSVTYLRDTDLVSLGFTIRHFDSCNGMVSYPDGFQMAVTCRHLVTRPRYAYGGMGETSASAISSVVPTASVAPTAKALRP